MKNRGKKGSNKMGVLDPNISIITLNVNEVNTPIKR